MSVNLSPVGGVAGQFFDNNGDPLVGGKLFTYAAGTTTPQATYTSATGTTPNSNPIILNGGGRVPAEIWLTDGLEYKFVLYSSTDQLIGSWDNIIGINSNFVNFSTAEEVQTATADQTVFTLTTMSYQPGTNNLVVYVDGVNQIEGGAYSFVETDSTTITFTTGLHVGALVKFVSAEILSTGVVNAANVVYNPAGSGAVSTNVQAKLRETVSVKDFGAVGDGVVDDTAAIQAAIDYAGPLVIAVCFPSGQYLVTDTINTNSSGLVLFGEGRSSRIITASDFDLFVFNLDERDLNFIQIRNLFFDHIGATHTKSAVLFGGPDNTQQYGASHCVFENLIIRNFSSAFRFAKPRINFYEGIQQIAAYGHIIFENIQLPFSALCDYGVIFEHGPGAHNLISGCTMQCNVACIQMGDNSADCGLGDQLIIGSHLLNADFGILIKGSDTAGRYNQNITVTGCHFDGISDATVRMENMRNFRVFSNNSTASTGTSHNPNCTDYIDESRNFVAFNTRADKPFLVGGRTPLPGPGFTSKTQLQGVDAGASSLGIYRVIDSGGGPSLNFVKARDEAFAVQGGAGAGIGTLNFANANGEGAAVAGAIVSAIATANINASGGQPSQIDILTTTNTGASPDIGVQLLPSGTFRPVIDNTQNLGTAANRWGTVFAGTGAINTSDASEKQDIVNLTDAEKRVAIRIKGLIKTFKFKNAVAQKGNEARIHVGVIAQDVKTAFEAEGIDANQYGMFCADTLEDGSVRLGVRYDELLAFVIGAI